MADILSRFSWGQPMRNYLSQGSDDEAMANYLAMQTQQPVRNGLDRDALLPWAYEVKDGQRSQNGQLAVPQLGVDVWNAIKSVGNAPLTAPYNPAERDSMIEHAGAVVGPMAGVGIARGAMTRAPTGSMDIGMFGGRRAKTADQAALAKAEALDAAGTPREQIWNDTGWFKGIDGKWRFEIDDSGVRVNVPAGSMFDDMHKLPMAVQHQSLIDAYPDMAHGRIGFDGRTSDSNITMGVDPRDVLGRTGDITIGIQGREAKPARIRGNTLHELQHAIQSREKFSPGQYPDGMVDLVRRAAPGLSDETTWNAALEAYRQSAGEVEARTVQKRMDMTPDQRRARAPWLDYDVPEANQIVTMGNGGPQYSLTDQPGIRAYHGSPHDFDRFSLDKIGTGEGTQAYGHGLYFAENEAVAKAYRDASADISTGKVNGRPFDATQPADNAAFYLSEAGGDRNKALATVARHRQGMKNQAYWSSVEDAIKSGGESKVDFKTPGRMYEVSIKASPDDFLDWDKPLSQQSEKVKKVIESALRKAAADFGQGASPEKIAQFEAMGLKNIADRMRPNSIDPFSLDVTTVAKQYPNALREAGIPGIKYLDQGSRAKGDGSRNYVVFDESLISILRKYGLLPLVGTGAAASAGQDASAAPLPPDPTSYLAR